MFQPRRHRKWIRIGCPHPAKARTCGVQWQKVPGPGGCRPGADGRHRSQSDNWRRSVGTVGAQPVDWGPDLVYRFCGPRYAEILSGGHSLIGNGYAQIHRPARRRDGGILSPIISCRNTQRKWSGEDGCFVGSAPPVIGPCCHGDGEATGSVAPPTASDRYQTSSRIRGCPRAW